MKTLFFWSILVLALFAIVITGISWGKQRIVAKNYPPIGQFIEVDGVRLHFIKAGTGPALILIHGAGGNIRDFTFSQFDKLSKDYTLIAFDRPGYGYSPAQSNGPSLKYQSDLLVKASQKLGVQHATVLGYSYGGAVAARMALDHPEFAKKLMLIAPLVHDWPGNDVSWEHHILSIPFLGPIVMNTVYALRGDGYFRPLYEGVFTPQSAPLGYIDHVGLGLSAKPSTQVENSRQIIAVADEVQKMIPRYAELTQSVEIIHGTADQSVSLKYHSQDFMRDAPKAEINAVFPEGMGHGIHQLAEDEILKALKRLSKRP